eukprot:scaffold5422_cov36-Tisochrysis_lutea.AAC.3
MGMPGKVPRDAMAGTSSWVTIYPFRYRVADKDDPVAHDTGQALATSRNIHQVGGSFLTTPSKRPARHAEVLEELDQRCCLPFVQP